MSNVSRGCCLSNRCGGWCRTLLCHSVRIALPDEVFVGLNTLVGLAYLSGYERIVVPMAACFVMAIIYLTEISLHSSSTGSAFSRIINLAGIVVCIAC